MCTPSPAAWPARRLGQESVVNCAISSLLQARLRTATQSARLAAVASGGFRVHELQRACKGDQNWRCAKAGAKGEDVVCVALQRLLARTPSVCLEILVPPPRGALDLPSAAQHSRPIRIAGTTVSLAASQEAWWALDLLACTHSAAAATGKPPRQPTLDLGSHRTFVRLTGPRS